MKENEQTCAEYKKLFIENKILTLSQFDHQISRDTEEFVVHLFIPPKNSFF